MSNPITDYRAPIVSQNAPPSATSPATASSGGILGSDGFLSKAGETFIDLVGLYGEYDLRKTELENTGNDRRNPEQEASERRAGMIPQTVRFVSDNRVPIYVVGGIAAVGIIAAIVINQRKK